MNITSDNLKLFFEKIKSLTFWQRVFYWSSIRSLSYEAYEEFRDLYQRIDSLGEDVRAKDARIGELEKDIKILNSRIGDISGSNQKLEVRAASLEADLRKAVSEKGEMAARIAKYEQADQSKLDEYRKNVAGVNAIRDGLENDRKKLHDDRLREKEEAFEKMKQTWQSHEEMVRKTIMNICQVHMIEYVKDVPFRGKPDNTLNIAGEYVIFDAKSPGGDDLENFPKYLKIQTESVSKYLKQENVRSDIFLVIPSNTVDVVNQFSYRMGDYNVYIVTIDALEPIILSLKRIEDYEFVDQLAPEERENICRIIGKFSHTAKRKIMIDYFFSFQFLDIISKCDLSLPADIQKAVMDFEKSEKLNPPQEKRAKQILLDEILKESERLALETKARIRNDDDA